MGGDRRQRPYAAAAASARPGGTVRADAADVARTPDTGICSRDKLHEKHCGTRYHMQSTAAGRHKDAARRDDRRGTGGKAFGVLPA